jgi:hypothetical protein
LADCDQIVRRFFIRGIGDAADLQRADAVERGGPGSSPAARRSDSALVNNRTNGGLPPILLIKSIHAVFEA